MLRVASTKAFQLPKLFCEHPQVDKAERQKGRSDDDDVAKHDSIGTRDLLKISVGSRGTRAAHIRLESIKHADTETQ